MIEVNKRNGDGHWGVELHKKMNNTEKVIQFEAPQIQGKENGVCGPDNRENSNGMSLSEFGSESSDCTVE